MYSAIQEGKAFRTPQNGVPRCQAIACSLDYVSLKQEDLAKTAFAAAIESMDPWL